MTAMTPAQYDALEALLRERAERLRDDLGYAAAVMDVCAADAIRSLRDELADAHCHRSPKRPRRSQA